MHKTSKIYVAGHLGLVGSAISKSLRERGYTNVIGRSIGELDLKDRAAVDEFFALEQPEYVFLAAAKVGGIAANNTYRGEFIFDNLSIQNNIIDAAYRHRVKKLLFLGSTCIYPRNAPQPMPEDCLLTSPLEYTNEPYAIAKIAGIKLCESYNIQYGTNFIAVMPTNLYGPNDNFDLEKSHVLPAMIRKIHLAKALNEGDWATLATDFAKRPVDGVDGVDGNNRAAILEKLGKYGITPSRVELWGTGKPMREFLWSEDMADACVYVMERVDWIDLSAAKAEKRNCHINIGTGREVSTGELARLVAAKIGYKGELFFNTDKPDGTMRKLTDPSKIHSLGWHHSIEIEEGVEKLYNWYLQ